MRFGSENTQFVTAANEIYKLGRYGYIVIVSGADNTEVTIQDPKGQVWSYILDRLQTYTHTATALADDLTGYLINSNKPVSVFSGMESNLVLGYRGRDAMYISLPPSAFLATTYFIPPIMERPRPEAHAVRVIALEATKCVT